MKATSTGSYLKIEVEDKESPPDLMGLKKKYGESFYRAPLCMVNAIILGRDMPTSQVMPDSLVHCNNLYDYQKMDVAKMVGIHHVLNANKMGYGKTVEAIIAMRELNANRVLIVCPKSIRYQWQAQIQKWWPERGDDAEVGFGPITIINYEQLTNQQNITKLKSVVWDVIVADEAHRIKNKKSKRTVALKSIPGRRRWALTGTPVTNRPDDLWSLLHYLHPDYVGKSYWEFIGYFCEIEHGVFGDVVKGLTQVTGRIEVLHKLLDAVAIRNPDLKLTKGKQVQIVPLEMSTSQKALYKSTKNLLLDSLPEEMTIGNGAVHLLRLQQVANYPKLWGCESDGVKFEYIKDQVEDYPDTKFVIFSHFATVAIALSQRLADISELYIGDMNSEDRFGAIKKFKQDSKCRVLIGTIGALGEGVDGLQDVCHNVIFVDRDWSSETMQQCEDRVNRLGQKEMVIVKYLECIGSIDKYIGRVVLRKAEDIRRLLNEIDSSI